MQEERHLLRCSAKFQMMSHSALQLAGALCGVVAPIGPVLEASVSLTGALAKLSVSFLCAFLNA